MITRPKFAVGRNAVDQGVTTFEIGHKLAEAGNLGWTDEGEVFWPEKHNLPLPLVGGIGGIRMACHFRKHGSSK